MSFNPVHTYAMFADESGISGDRFTVVGGICMHINVAKSVYETIKNFRSLFNMTSELKWQKVSNQKQKEYASLVEYFFALNNTNHIQFHCIIFDSHQWNHNKYNNGDRDVGLSKLYYQLILHKFIKSHAQHGSLFVCLDRRNSSTSLEVLRKMLNDSAWNHFSFLDPVKQLVSRDSREDDILQLNDVILGAVCAARNGKHLLATTREAKRSLALMVLEKSGVSTFSENTHRSIHRFTVWNMKAR